MKIIVGLGNPGEKYLKTRHNVGFMVIDQFALQLGIDCNIMKFQSFIGKGTADNEGILLVKPQTYMNKSGIAVREVVNMYTSSLQDILVVCDDLDLPFGKIRVRRSGGSGGHRGLESIAASLGSKNFPRLRVGIGKSLVAGDTANYVLSLFSREEEAILIKAVGRACQAVKTWIAEGINVCMNTFN
ncbi:MAG: aminoacyl-tRNA hydrolase [Candidatus Loosdrechtia sp.]|uniref:aminoacyl-tRNA hydrolase n=1 Tax=Candidatus Loosdrechtia sp. TaxID=3101272 RepID=UPI003A6BB61B|nr:MAG: aminoacyl-tRNA hydrolase [Candidatus Jettenia sp. AMX2]